MSKNKLYIVSVFKWGRRDSHSYFVGVFSKKQKAIDEANKEEKYRGGIKYQAEIIETEINISYAEGCNPWFKRIKALEGEE